MIESSTMNNKIQDIPGSCLEIPELASVVTKAMISNPLHLAIFNAADESAEMMQTKMFNMVLKLPTCNLFVAKCEGRVVGVMNYYKSGYCQISPLKTLSMLPGLSFTLKGRLPRVLKWKSNWAKHDPRDEHFHFGRLTKYTLRKNIHRKLSCRKGIIDKFNFWLVPNNYSDIDIRHISHEFITSYDFFSDLFENAQRGVGRI